jgi:tetratricopeptide (TPR) repeat protein
LANKDKLLANAQKFISKGQLPKAINEYRKLVDAFPKDVRNRQKLAELLNRDNRNEDALIEFEAVAKHFTDTGFYLKAIALFKQMQKIDASRVDIYHRLAELNEKQGLVGNALTEYRNLISFYEKNQMYQEAIEVLEKMLELDPENLNFAAKIAECYKAAGQSDEALKRFQSIIEPISEKGEHLKVVKLYERFLDICPEDGSSRIPLAKALIHTGSAEKAILILKGLLKQSPEDTVVNRCLADAYVASQDFPNAQLTLKHLLKITGEDLDLREYYVRICIDAGEPETARDRLEEWKDTFFHAERVSSLKAFYEELKDLLVADAVITDTLAVIYEAVGEASKLDDLETSSQAPEV